MEIASDLLPQDTLAPLMQARIAELESATAKLALLLKKAPAGNLKISPHRGTYQYFLEKGGTTYLPHGSKIAQALAQRDYNHRILEATTAQLATLKKCIAKYTAANPEGIYTALHPARKSLVTPAILPDGEFAQRWECEQYEGKSFESATEIITARGERVRSKSENIIADTLYRLNIPYKYERPLTLKKGNRKVTIFPDFTCLNTRRRKEFIWEHFGLADNTDYAENMVGKLNMYQANGFFYGENFIMTYETSTQPLSAVAVERLAKRYLLDKNHYLPSIF